MRTYSIYVHTNKKSGKKYYGMTLQKPERRWGRNGNNYKTNQAFREAIERDGWDGFTHEVLARDLPFREAFLLERMYIRRDDTTNPERGYNRHPGTYPTRESCYKNISVAKMGHSVSWTTREKIRRAIPRRPVTQYTLSGERLRTFASITDAARAVNLHKSKIWAVCAGEKRTARGFIWRYASSADARIAKQPHERTE